MSESELLDRVRNLEFENYCLLSALRAKRIWYWPPWQLTEPWKVEWFTGTDEFGRETIAIHLSLLGCFIFARPLPPPTR